jgi:hypothetical protein
MLISFVGEQKVLRMSCMSNAQNFNTVVLLRGEDRKEQVSDV